MSGQDYPERSTEATDSPEAASPLARIGQAPTSRRTLLRRGVGFSAIGLAVAAGGGGAAAALLSHSQGDGTQAATDASSSGPIVIYMANPQSGEMDIFAGTSKTHATNKAMASMVSSMAPH